MGLLTLLRMFILLFRSFEAFENRKLSGPVSELNNTELRFAYKPCCRLSFVYCPLCALVSVFRI